MKEKFKALFFAALAVFTISLIVITNLHAAEEFSVPRSCCMPNESCEPSVDITPFWQPDLACCCFTGQGEPRPTPTPTPRPTPTPTPPPSNHCGCIAISFCRTRITQCDFTLGNRVCAC